MRTCPKCGGLPIAQLFISGCKKRVCGGMATKSRGSEPTSPAASVLRAANEWAYRLFTPRVVLENLMLQGSSKLAAAYAKTFSIDPAEAWKIATAQSLNPRNKTEEVRTKRIMHLLFGYASLPEVELSERDKGAAHRKAMEMLHDGDPKAVLDMMAGVLEYEEFEQEARNYVNHYLKKGAIDKAVDTALYFGTDIGCIKPSKRGQRREMLDLAGHSLSLSDLERAADIAMIFLDAGDVAELKPVVCSRSKDGLAPRTEMATIIKSAIAFGIPPKDFTALLDVGNAREIRRK